MSIDFYCIGIIYFYNGLRVLLLCIGAVGLWYKIRKRPFKFDWLMPYIPYSILYLISSPIFTFTAYMAYDDMADPNYHIYKDWGLADFILSDIKRFIIWLCIGAVLFFIMKKGPRDLKIAIHCVIGTLAALAVLATLLMMVSVMIGNM